MWNLFVMALPARQKLDEIRQATATRMVQLALIFSVVPCLMPEAMII
jgi:hypothetical protein